MARRLIVAGVIRRSPTGDPNRRREMAVVADLGHPRGPIVSTVAWDRAYPEVRGEMLDGVFRNVAATAEEGQP